MGFQDFGNFHSRHPAIRTTGLLTFALAGLSPAEHISVNWSLPSDMLAVRNRAIDGRGLSPPRSAALLAAPDLHSLLLAGLPALRKSGPLYRCELTSMRRLATSLMGHFRTHAPQQTQALFRSPRQRVLIRATPLSEGPQSTASRLFARPGRSTQIL